MIFGPRDRDERAIAIVESLRADIQYAILKALKAAGLSRSQLAERMNCTPSWVSQLLSDDANLTLDSVAKVFAALDVPAEACRFECGAADSAAREAEFAAPRTDRGGEWIRLWSAAPAGSTSRRGGLSKASVRGMLRAGAGGAAYDFASNDNDARSRAHGCEAA